MRSLDIVIVAVTCNGWVEDLRALRIREQSHAMRIHESISAIVSFCSSIGIRPASQEHCRDRLPRWLLR
jgi:hypothetical protein